MPRWFVLVFLLTLGGAILHTQPQPPQEVAQEKISLSDYTWQNIELPPDFLKLISTGVAFAFSTGAAREISFQDLYHFHVLEDCTWPPTKSILETIARHKGILFHTQELVERSHAEKMKRNIIVHTRKPDFLIPGWKSLADGSYTVNPHELGFCSSQGYLIELTETETKSVRPHLAKNIITIKGKKIWVGFIVLNPR